MLLEVLKYARLAAEEYIILHQNKTLNDSTIARISRADQPKHQEVDDGHPGLLTQFEQDLSALPANTHVVVKPVTVEPVGVKPVVITISGDDEDSATQPPRKRARHPAMVTNQSANYNHSDYDRRDRVVEHPRRRQTLRRARSPSSSVHAANDAIEDIPIILYGSNRTHHLPDMV